MHFKLIWPKPYNGPHTLHHNALFIQTILHSLNISTEIKPVKYAYSYIKNANVNNSNRISAGLYTALATRAQDVIYTNPVYVSTSHCMVHSKFLITDGFNNVVTYPLRPMAFNAWVCLFACTILFILTLNAIRQLKNIKQFSIFTIDWTEIKGELFWNTDKGFNPAISCLKLFWTFVIIFSFFQYYIANLLTNTVESSFPKPMYKNMEAIHEAFKQDGLKYVTHRNIFKSACPLATANDTNHSVPNICNEITPSQRIKTSSITETIAQVLSKKFSVGDIGGSEYISVSLRETACDLWVVPTTFFGHLMASHIVPKTMNKKLLERINRQILYGVSVRKHLMRSKQNQWASCFLDKTIKNPELLPFTMNQIKPILWIWVGGMSASVGIFFLEVIIGAGSKYKELKKFAARKKQTMP